ncbi:Tubulin glycylase 3C [Hondaea fermentalgiana]|uniref:Tubulin--tyrosine ligase n=1 Tax=Hondaea fermentalgiana TaxID=2315210 RepID=A0A2R5GL04_9STRA|nr:Tubulin glycylase 3C [Hondaea fermentalgiana]|eukprot:GBG31586.1 Tubulin glycylase 3C [Hondaea fermentalgiana]
MPVLWTCSPSWEWAFRAAADGGDENVGGSENNAEVAWRAWEKVDKLTALPSYDRSQGNALLRIEAVDDENCQSAEERKTPSVTWFGAGCFDSLGDKDMLWMVLERLGLERFVPATSVLVWDVDKVDQVLLPATADDLVVLKPPLGCHGEGIVFFETGPSKARETQERILAIISEDAKRARAERGFLEHLLQRKGRLPGWVLQAHIRSMLLQGDRKFHLRAYVLADDAKQTLFRYATMEARVAEMAYNATDCNDRASHITNGAGGDRIQRVLVRELPELAAMQDRLDSFVDELLADPGFRDAVFNHAHRPPERKARFGGRFAIGALDLMIDDTGRPWILEVNARSPGCAPEGTGSAAFQAHMCELAGELLRFGAASLDDEPVEVREDGFQPVAQVCESDK